MPVDLSMVGLQGQQVYNETQVSKANAQLLNANAMAKQQEVEEAERDKQLDLQVAQMMGGIGRGEKGGTAGSEELDDEVETRAAALRRGAEIMFAGGAVDRGTKMLEAADKIQKSEDDLLNSQVTREQNKLESQLKTADLTYRYIGTAKNQSEYDAGRDFVLNNDAFSDEDKDWIRKLPKIFDPEITRFMADKAIAAKDAAQLALTARGRDQQDRNMNETAAYRASLLAQRQAIHDETIRQKELDRKGGKSASAPNGGEIKSAEAAVVSQVFNGEAPDEDNPAFKAGAQAVAARAKEKVRDNPALNWNVAVAQAVMESKANGDWKAVRNYRGLPGTKLFDTKGTTSIEGFEKKGLTADKAVPLPPRGTKPETGIIYITSRGKAVWNGTSFEPVK